MRSDGFGGRAPLGGTLLAKDEHYHQNQHVHLVAEAVRQCERLAAHLPLVEVSTVLVNQMPEPLTKTLTVTLEHSS